MNCEFTKDELKRIQISKYFFFRLNETEKEFNEKVKELENFINKNAPAGYKKDLSFNLISVQESKKNYSSEVLFLDFEEKINSLKLEIEKLKEFFNKNISLACKLCFKMENFQEKYLLLDTFIFKTNKNFRIKTLKIKTNKDFENILNKGLISFSYILDSYYKEKKRTLEK